MGWYKGYCFKVYTVYDNRTDRLLCLDAPASEAMKVMGVSEKGFYSAVCRSLKGINKKWHIEVAVRKEIEYDDT